MSGNPGGTGCPSPGPIADPARKDPIPNPAVPMRAAVIGDTFRPPAGLVAVAVLLIPFRAAALSPVASTAFAVPVIASLLL